MPDEDSIIPLSQTDFLPCNRRRELPVYEQPPILLPATMDPRPLGQWSESLFLGSGPLVDPWGPDRQRHDAGNNSGSEPHRIRAAGRRRSCALARRDGTRPRRLASRGGSRAGGPRRAQPTARRLRLVRHERRADGVARKPATHPIKHVTASNLEAQLLRVGTLLQIVKHARPSYPNSDREN